MQLASVSKLLTCSGGGRAIVWSLPFGLTLIVTGTALLLGGLAPSSYEFFTPYWYSSFDGYVSLASEQPLFFLTLERFEQDSPI